MEMTLQKVTFPLTNAGYPNTDYRESGQYYWQPATLPAQPGVLFCRLRMGSATRTIRLIQN